MGELIKIRYTDSLYVVRRGNKYNITAIAITDQNKKIASSMYITRDDVMKLYEAYEAAINNNHTIFDTTISKGVFKINKIRRKVNDTKTAEGYMITIGDYVSSMTIKSYNEFIFTLKDAYEYALNRPSIENFKSYFNNRKKKMSKKKKKGIFE